MLGFGKSWWGVAVMVTSLGAFPACRKPAESAKSDLDEVGYQLTTADWFRASRNNDLSALKKFVAGGIAIDTRDSSGDSALHAAAASGAQDSADFLMDRGLLADLRGASERTPLMAAVLANQRSMVRWLLRQGADPRAKDDQDFTPLMLAVRAGKSGPVEELASSNRENLDSAILLAALIGQTDVIDTLTKYGASVYARMDDGRTPLMIAAENGHMESVKLLLEIGSSRMSTDSKQRTAADLAAANGHQEIAAHIARDPLPDELALESPAEVAKSMDAFVTAAAAENQSESQLADGSRSPAISNPTGDSTNDPTSPARPIQGEILSASTLADIDPVGGAGTAKPSTPPDATRPPAKSFPVPPLVMRHYREREMPVEVRTVEGEIATLAIVGTTRREIKVRAGETIPGSRLSVVRVQRRMESSKLNLGNPMEVSVVEVRDTASGTTREWISGVSASAHDPVALVEDSATGKRYIASPGQRFKSADGSEFIVSDVRPNQLIIEDAASGTTQTIPLRGSRG